MAKTTPFESPAILREPPPVPELAPMPSPAAMSAMSNADLSELLRRHRVRQDWNSLISETQKFNEPFMRIAPVDPVALEARAQALYQPAVHDLRKLARRTQERYTTAEAIDGAWDTAVLVRVAELDDVTCDGCESNAGFEGTYQEQEAVGLPGQQECGGNCRCQLVRVEGGGASAAGMGVALVAAAAAVTALVDEGEEEQIEEAE
jgi:hypothetical protein